MPPPFEKGRRLNQYVILEKIYHGGKADVFFAEDAQKHRKVALKVIRDKVLNPELKAAWLSHAANLARLDHPGLAKIHEAMEFENHPAVAMDFCEGQSLKDLLNGFEATPQKAIDVITQVLEAVDYMHRNNIVYGPLAPSDIIIGLDGRAKIIGFEESIIAALYSTEGRPPSLSHPDYTAPEILNGSIPDQRSDLFSVGVLMYELLAGESPFKGDNREESAELVKAHTPTALSKIKPDLPRALDNIMQRLLCKDPEHRYQSAGEILAELRAIKFNGRASAGDVPPVDWWNRYIVPAAVLVLIIIAILWLMK